MKPEQQRIAIAEACGWTELNLSHHKQVLTGIPPQNYPTRDRISIPNYLNNLDAMHAAEKVKEMLFDSEYSYWLAHISVRDRGLNEDSTELVDGYQMAITSTAAQRAEAFLRTLNLWQE